MRYNIAFYEVLFDKTVHIYLFLIVLIAFNHLQDGFILHFRLQLYVFFTAQISFSSLPQIYSTCTKLSSYKLHIHNIMMNILTLLHIQLQAPQVPALSVNLSILADKMELTTLVITIFTRTVSQQYNKPNRHVLYSYNPALAPLYIMYTIVSGWAQPSNLMMRLMLSIPEPFLQFPHGVKIPLLE